jgi:SAM-dependent methyltransferase
MEAQEYPLMDSAIFSPHVRLRVLVAVASHGTSNDHHLLRLVEEYRTMSFDIDIVVLSNLKKQIAPDIEVLVGLPNRNPWSLPFAHKKLFADRLERYDLFVYSEDDILITERNLRAFLAASAALGEDELPGFLRIEYGANGIVNYPDVDWHFHWDPTSIRTRGQYTAARFTNEHAACYVLTRAQLRKAIRSSGFLVKPHEDKYDLLCTAATDPYTQCGFTKLIPISHLDEFTVHHLSNKYVGRVGVDDREFQAQVQTMLQLAGRQCAPLALLNTETRLWRGIYSKDYYEPPSTEALSMLPQNARSILSIGCGSGAAECQLVERGLRVVAVPLDPIICSTAATRGVEIVSGDFDTAKNKLSNERFDCVLYLNLLHLTRDPIQVLSLFREVLVDTGSVIILSPNMMGASNVWRRFRNLSRRRDRGIGDWADIHFATPANVTRWCTSAGLKAGRIVGILDQRAEIIRGRTPRVIRDLAPDFVKLFMANTFVTTAYKA